MLSFRNKDDDAVDGTPSIKDVVAAIAKRGAVGKIGLNLCILLAHDRALGRWKHERFQFSRLLADNEAEICKKLGCGELLRRDIPFRGDKADNPRGFMLSFLRLQGANIQHVSGELVEHVFVPTSFHKELGWDMADVGFFAIDRLALDQGKFGLFEFDFECFSEIFNIRRGLFEASCFVSFQECAEGIVLLVSSRTIGSFGSPALGIDSALECYNKRNTKTKIHWNPPYDFVGCLVVGSENSQFLELLVTLFESSLCIMRVRARDFLHLLGDRVLKERLPRNVDNKEETVNELAYVQRKSSIELAAHFCIESGRFSSQHEGVPDSGKIRASVESATHEVVDELLTNLGIIRIGDIDLLLESEANVELFLHSLFGDVYVDAFIQNLGQKSFGGHAQRAEFVIDRRTAMFSGSGFSLSCARKKFAHRLLKHFSSGFAKLLGDRGREGDRVKADLGAGASLNVKNVGLHLLLLG